MKKTDNAQLVACIEACFLLATSSELPPKKRSEMLALGKRMRGSLMNLLTAQFADDLKEVDDANAQIQAVNERLSDSEATIAKIADTIKDVNKLITTLDKLLNFAIATL